MALKRKRSSAAFSSPISIGSDTTINCVPFFYQTHKSVEPICHKPSWCPPSYDDSLSRQHLNSRTRKRHRDDRPDERVVHSAWIGGIMTMSTLADICRIAASTIEKLYDAQRQHPTAEPVPSHPASIKPMEVAATRPQKTTLHTFWKIAQPPSTALNPGVVSPACSSARGLTVDWELRCEDCNHGLRNDDAMDLDDAQGTACHRCRRHVCDGCAVTWNERVCLPCACR